MRIAVFYHLDFSGAKRVVKEHVKGLKQLGNMVDLYTTINDSDIFDPAIFSDKAFYYNFSPTDIHLPIIKRVKKDFVDTFILLNALHKKIAYDIDSKSYDIVLVHTDIHTQAPFLLKHLKTNNAYFCLEPLRNAYEYSLRLNENAFFLNRAYEDFNRWIRKRIDRENTRSAKNILTLSLFARERIISAYDLYPQVCSLGVDEKIFKPLSLKKKNQILFVAEKRKIYGYDLAAKALELIPHALRPELRVIDWKKDNAERLTDKELVNEYNCSLITLSLSRFDTFGLAPLESMSCGVPVIALNVAGYKETVKDKQTGLLTEFDAKDISDKIIYLLRNKERIKEMGINARQTIIQNWTWKKQVLLLNKILNDFIGNGKDFKTN